jgi:hypothetical protein
MIPVFQTKTTLNDGVGNCMGACVASIMERPLKDVLDKPGPSPLFWQRWEDWFIQQGLFLNHRGEPPKGYAIAGGDLISGGKRLPHYVVVFNGIKVHDPYPLGGEFVKAVEYFTIDLIGDEQRPYCDERLAALSKRTGDRGSATLGESLREAIARIVDPYIPNDLVCLGMEYELADEILAIPELASAIPSRRADDAEGGSAGTEGSAVPQADAQTEGE